MAITKSFDKESALGLIGWAVRNPTEFAEEVAEYLIEEEFVHEYHYDALGIIEIVAATYGNLQGFREFATCELEELGVIGDGPEQITAEEFAKACDAEEWWVWEDSILNRVQRISREESDRLCAEWDRIDRKA